MTMNMPGLKDGIYGITNCELDRCNNAALLNDNDHEDIRGVFPIGKEIYEDAEKVSHLAQLIFQ